MVERDLLIGNSSEVDEGAFWQLRPTTLLVCTLIERESDFVNEALVRELIRG